MKYVTLIVFGAGLIAGSAFYVSRSNAGKSTATEVSTPGMIATQCPDSRQNDGRRAVRQPQAGPDAVAPETTGQSSASARPAKLDSAAVRQAVDALTSPTVSYSDKQMVWKQLKDNASLDPAIHELEQRLAGNSSDAENAAVLGHAYLQKCGTISDVREQGILAMQADKLFDTALNVDPANWDARFNKAVALSYWPASMGKGEEVLQHFTTLIQQQETQAPQPQFAEPYAWLGDQYQKAGRNEDARSVWERGAQFFPDNEKLRSKLASIR